MYTNCSDITYFQKTITAGHTYTPLYVNRWRKQVWLQPLCKISRKCLITKSWCQVLGRSQLCVVSVCRSFLVWSIWSILDKMFQECCKGVHGCLKGNPRLLQRCFEISWVFKGVGCFLFLSSANKVSTEPTCQFLSFRLSFRSFYFQGV